MEVEKVSVWLENFLQRGLPYSQSNFQKSYVCKILNCEITILIVYVDDIVVIGDAINEINKLKACLANAFKIIRQLRYFNEIEVTRSDKDISCLNKMS